MHQDHASNTNQHVARILDLYKSTNFKPPPSQHTILASFYLTRQLLDDNDHSLDLEDNFKIISLATGTKCLPMSKLPLRGEMVHDSHAEVLARRGAIRWFMEEVQRVECTPHPSDAEQNGSRQSTWIRRVFEAVDNGEEARVRYALQEGVKVNLYISTVPCGDASMRYLAAFQDPAMAALKDSSNHVAVPTLELSEGDTMSRGRNNYSLFGVLRTKPGRADSPPTSCMSCSDKIASWNVLGFQGALATYFLEPLYIDKIVIGEVEEGLQPVVREDCERAFWGRLLSPAQEDISSWAGPIKKPTIEFNGLPFPHSRLRTAMPATTLHGEARIESTTLSNSCNESLCWIADAPSFDVFINGMKRGVPPKHRFREKSRPQVSKIALFNLCTQILASSKSWSTSTPLPDLNVISYTALKQRRIEYQRLKLTLLGSIPEEANERPHEAVGSINPKTAPSRPPFGAWIRSGCKTGHFNIAGEEVGILSMPMILVKGE
ncbi:hypothetical protein AX16_003844 [Volvariella volvacea WC 439]|nr:hypothetical protein AX16_003844 [Volvariella volvacea WC 439]